MNNELGILEETIIRHAAELADKEWHNEQKRFFTRYWKIAAWRQGLTNGRGIWLIPAH